jgi:hypothetical protein
MDQMQNIPAQNERGCVFFNFGSARALMLLVSIHSLRKHYGGPITVFLEADKYSDLLGHELETCLDARVVELKNLSKSFDRHRMFLESPYKTTLSFDSDIMFQSPIDDLWEPLEDRGVLVTRMYALPYGFGGTEESPCTSSRVIKLVNIKDLVDPVVFAKAYWRLTRDGIDINIGVIGISRPKGDAFLLEWARRIEMGRSSSIPILDEMLAVALVGEYQHFLADEKWNCPADEAFRQTNLTDAHVIHYFADGHLFGAQRLGRNAATFAGRKWYKAYFDAAGSMDLSLWRQLDRRFDRRVEPPFSNGIFFALRNWPKDLENGVRKIRNFVRRKSPLYIDR